MKKTLTFIFGLLAATAYGQTYSIDTDYGMLLGTTYGPFLGPDDEDYMNMADKFLPTPEGGSLLFYSNYDGFDIMQLYMSKLNSDGTYDDTFGEGGVVQIFEYLSSSLGDPFNAYEDILIDEFSNVYLCGGHTEDIGSTEYNAFLAKYNANGTLDTSFGDGGFFYYNQLYTAFQLKQLNDDGFILAGITSFSANTFGVIKVLPDGTLDETFGDAGLASLNAAPYDEYPMALEIDADGKIVVGVKYTWKFEITSPGGFQVVRFTADGEPDSTFHEDGVFSYESGLGTLLEMQMYEDGRILLGGRTEGSYLSWEYDFVLLRLTTDGYLDPTFSDDGIGIYGVPEAGEWIKSIVIRENGSILAGGSQVNPSLTTKTDVVIFEVDSAGNRNETFNETGSITLDWETYYNICWSGVCLEQDYLVDFFLLPDQSLLLASSILNGYNLFRDRGKQAVIKLKDSGCIVASATIYPTLCEGDSLYVGGNWVSEPGIYAELNSTEDGCDSITHYHFDTDRLNATGYPYAEGISFSYEPTIDSAFIIDCSTQQVVQSFYEVGWTLTVTLNQSGSYAMVAYFGACLDTSACTEFVLDTTIIESISLHESGFSVYPNPASTHFQLSGIDLNDPSQQCHLFSVTGQEQPLTYAITGANTAQFDISTLPTGLYLLQVGGPTQPKITIPLVKTD